MGERGPGKLPTSLKLLHGERRPSRLNRAAPQPRSGFPAMPRDMAPDAQVVWRRIRRSFEPTGVLTEVDGDALRAYCESTARYVKASRMLDHAGLLIRGARGGELVRNPLAAIARDNAILMRLFGRDLGFSPSAREGLRAPGPGSDDPLARWLAGTG